MNSYNHSEIEKRAREKWEKNAAFKVKDSLSESENEYILVEFPYPSGNLHVGHWYAFAVTDIYARYRKMLGQNVLFPIGFDAFGLPAENAAIKHGLNPKVWTYQNIDHMKEQLNSMGAMFDWSREVITCDPTYYKWTQWLFLKFYEKGLAYQAETNVNWCPKCKTVLANEQVKAGLCERCDSQVEQRKMNQWQLKITDYADRLVDDLDGLDWPEPIKHSQRNWIGRSEGAKLKFPLVGLDEEIEIFTTRPDTIFGATYMVLAPEHPLLEKISEQISNWPEVSKYIKDASNKSELDRISDAGEKTGIALDGVRALNPANSEEIPIFVADYVLGHYGTGAIMAVPAHDERDFEFAKKFDLKIISVISGGADDKAYLGEGILINSGEFDGLNSEAAKQKITEKLGGELTKNYRLRDWLVSRQRYWGCPIPIIHCEKCGNVPVSEADLPVVLPEIGDYTPRDDGKSPLAKTDWSKVSCPKCGAPAQRETDTLDTFIDSSWYYLRYVDPNNSENFASKEKIKQWMPVNFYSGGAEHTTMHLLFARFFNKVLFDLGLVTEDEPFKNRLNRGLILGPDGNKMSKSKGNVIDPDEIVANMGADTVRTYLAFIGPYNEVGSYPWNQNGVVGMRRFLEKVWGYTDKLSPENKTDEIILKSLHKLIKRVTEEFAQLKFNAGLAQMMTFVNSLEKSQISIADFLEFLKMLSVVAPHLTEEIWDKLGQKGIIFNQKWPTYNPSLIKDDQVKIAVQVNGKVRDILEVSPDLGEAEILALAQKSAKVQKSLENKDINKVIYIPGKILNIVI